MSQPTLFAAGYPPPDQVGEIEPWQYEMGMRCIDLSFPGWITVQKVKILEFNTSQEVQYHG